MTAAADLDVRTYARICVALADGASSRERVLAAHGLDEERWTAIDDAWQDRLSRAIEEHEGDAAPALVVEYDAALREARAGEAAGDVLSLEPDLAERFRRLTARDG